jgi:hypothetical protein
VGGACQVRVTGSWTTGAGGGTDLNVGATEISIGCARSLGCGGRTLSGAREGGGGRTLSGARDIGAASGLGAGGAAGTASVGLGSAFFWYERHSFSTISRVPREKVR